MRRTLTVFVLVAVVHFVLSVIGIVVALPAAFETQAGFWEAPGKATLAWIAAFLLTPLEWIQPLMPQQGGFGYGEIAIVSVLFGIAAVAIDRLWRALKRDS